jgi:hypothetical protein
MKCKEKVRIGSKVIKKYDDPKTPYHRIMKCKSVSKGIKRNLKKLYSSLNPVQIKREIAQLQGSLYNMAIKKPLYDRKKRPKNEPPFA